MTIRRRPAVEAAPLGEAVTLILLAGWGVGLDGKDRTGVFTMAMDRDGGEAKLWAAHEDFLRTEGKRRGIAPAWGPDGRLFYGEWCARVPNWRERARLEGEADHGDE
jgi:hypothetical protein